MDKDSYKKKFKTLKVVLQDSFKNLGIDSKLKEQEFLSAWDDVVGDKIASIAQPDYIRFKILFVNVADPIWIQQLSLMEDMIVDKLNRQSDRKLIEKIRFRFGKIQRGRDQIKGNTEKIRERRLSPLEREGIERELKPIKNQEIKDALKRLMVKGVVQREES